MARFSLPSFGEEATKIPGITQAIQSLYAGLYQGAWRPAELDALGTSVVFQESRFQLLGSICFVYLQFLADDLTWSWAGGPLLSLPVGTQKQSSLASPGGHVTHDAIKMTSSTTGNVYILRGQGTPVVAGDRYSIALAPDSTTPVAEASPSSYTISGWYWILI